MSGKPIPPLASEQGEEPWQRITDDDLKAYEQFLVEKNTHFIPPVDTAKLADICMHLIREVRATRLEKEVPPHRN